MTKVALAGSAGPHVFVESLDSLVLDADDLAHLSKSLRMRAGDPLTASDGEGRWREAEFGSGDTLTATSPVVTLPEVDRKTSVAFSLVKGQKPELVIQKLTELGVDRIVVLEAERSIVKWDSDKVERALLRWTRIVREASMQSHRVRMPELDALVPSLDWISRPDVAIAHFDGRAIGASDLSIAIGPEGGWSPAEVAAADHVVTLGTTVLRAETAAIAAGTLLSAVVGQPCSDGG